MALFTALIIGIFWAIFDFLRKKALNHFNEYEVLFVVIISQLILFSITLTFSGFTLILEKYYLYYIPLITLGLLAFFLFLKALKNSEISLTIPLLSFTPLFSAVYAFFLLDEKLSYYNYIGIFIVILGSFILYSRSLTLKDLCASPKALYDNYYAKLMLVVALIWSLTPVLDKKCLEYTDIYLHGFMQSIGWLIIIPFILKNKKIKVIKYIKKNDKLLIISIAIVGSVVSLTQLIALSYNMVPILESFKRSIGVILSLVFGYFFLKEEINLRKVLSVIIICIGLNLLLQ